MLPRSVKFESYEGDPQPQPQPQAQALDFTFDRFQHVLPSHAASDHVAVFLDLRI